MVIIIFNGTTIGTESKVRWVLESSKSNIPPIINIISLSCNRQRERERESKRTPNARFIKVLMKEAGKKMRAKIQVNFEQVHDIICYNK